MGKFKDQRLTSSSDLLIFQEIFGRVDLIYRLIKFFGNRFYTLTELGKMLGISVLVFREEIKAGELKVSKVDRTYYVAEPHLRAFIEEKRKKAE